MYSKLCVIISNLQFYDISWMYRFESLSLRTESCKSQDLQDFFIKNTYSFKCVNCDSYAVVLISWYENVCKDIKNIYDKKFPPPATIIIYDLLII